MSQRLSILLFKVRSTDNSPSALGCPRGPLRFPTSLVGRVSALRTVRFCADGGLAIDAKHCHANIWKIISRLALHFRCCGKASCPLCLIHRASGRNIMLFPRLGRS